jgi:small-conductance mechanosensitive channel
MISDSSVLKGILFVLMLASLLLIYYLWYLVLKQINATDFMWFIFVFMVFFGIIVAALRSVIDEAKIKDLQKRVKFLEDRR